MKMEIKYHGFHMPDKWTFRIIPIRKLLENYCRSLNVLFPFAGKERIRTCRTAVYIDIDGSVNPDLVGDCLDLIPTLDKTFDMVVLDPPFTFHQAVHTYGNERMSDIKRVKDLIDPLVRPNGYVITFAFNSTGMGKGRGYTKRQLHIFNHGGNHSDTLMLIEQKKNQITQYI